MIKFNALLIASAALAMGTIGFAAPAAASDVVNINVQNVNASQNAGPAVQNGLAATVAVGSVANDAALSATTVNGVNMATVDYELTQANSSFANGNLLNTQVGQAAASANQSAIAISGSGAMGAAASSTSLAANLVNSTNLSFKITQK